MKRYLFGLRAICELLKVIFLGLALAALCLFSACAEGGLPLLVAALAIVGCLALDNALWGMIMLAEAKIKRMRREIARRKRAAARREQWKNRWQDWFMEQQQEEEA